jgi:hypothetical protein
MGIFGLSQEQLDSLDPVMRGRHDSLKARLERKQQADRSRQTSQIDAGVLPRSYHRAIGDDGTEDICVASLCGIYPNDVGEGIGRAHVFALLELAAQQQQQQQQQQQPAESPAAAAPAAPAAPPPPPPAVEVAAMPTVPKGV